jgi:hypothetical protein
MSLNEEQTASKAEESTALFSEDTPLMATSSSSIVYDESEVVEETAEVEAEDQEQDVTADPDDAEPESSPEEDVPTVDWQKRYQNLESLYARQANELGNYRRTVKEKEAEPQAKDDDDEYIDLTDPQSKNKFVSSIVEQAERRAMERARAEIAREKAMYTLDQEHPDRMQITGTVGFQDWMRSVPEDIVKKGSEDPATASYLLRQYKASMVKPASKEPIRPKTEAKKATGLGSSTSKRESGGRKFSSSELLKMQMTDPENYARLQPEIMKAYREGRVI